MRLIFVYFGAISLLVAFEGRALSQQKWPSTTALRELPFCALLLRELQNPVSGLDEYVLTEPDEITEENLGLIFRTLSDRHPHSVDLQAWVYTDVAQLRWLATQSGHSGENLELDRHKWAYYHRTADREFFEFNPNFPEPGNKTVTLRGESR